MILVRQHGPQRRTCSACIKRNRWAPEVTKLELCVGCERVCDRLQTLNLSNTGLTGELPALWGVNGSLPSLTLLDVSRNGVSGD